LPEFFSRTNILSAATKAILVGEANPDTTCSTFKFGSLMWGSPYALGAAPNDNSDTITDIGISRIMSTRGFEITIINKSEFSKFH
jgi:hypothetical protein